MRDPARIDETVDALRDYWHANPDLRLAQIVNNAIRVAWAARRETPEFKEWLADDSNRVAPPFYVEDDVVGEGIAIMAKET